MNKNEILDKKTEKRLRSFNIFTFVLIALAILLTRLKKLYLGLRKCSRRLLRKITTIYYTSIEVLFSSTKRPKILSTSIFGTFLVSTFLTLTTLYFVVFRVEPSFFTWFVFTHFTMKTICQVVSLTFLSSFRSRK